MRTRLLPVGGRAPGRRPPTETGFTIVELLLVLALLVITAALSAPIAATQLDTGRARQASEFVAARFRLAHQQAVARSSSVAVVFDTAGGRTTIRLCADGNGDGVRRADITSGVDACPESPLDLETLFAGVRIASDPAIRGPDGEPGSADAIRFGRSDLASFSPTGTCSAGSLFLQSRSGTQYVVRVAASTSRTRVLRYDAVTRTWRDA